MKIILMALIGVGISAQTVELIPLTPSETQTLKDLEAKYSVAAKLANTTWGELCRSKVKIKSAHGFGGEVSYCYFGSYSSVDSSSATITSGNTFQRVTQFDKDYKYLVK